jgi:hypothetical protein
MVGSIHRDDGVAGILDEVFEKALGSSDFTVET